MVVVGTAPTAGMYATPTAADDRVRRHIQPLAILWTVNGILRLAEVAWLMMFGSLFVPGLHGMGPEPRLPFGWSLESLILRGMYAFGVSLALFGVLHLVLAWRLFDREPWARMLGIALGCFALLRFPFGTALGIYTLWVLLPESSAREYDRMSRGSDVSAARVST